MNSVDAFNELADIVIYFQFRQKKQKLYHGTLLRRQLHLCNRNTDMKMYLYICIYYKYIIVANPRHQEALSK